MNKWLEAHVYIAEWVGALFAVFAGYVFLTSAVNAGKRIATAYLTTVKAFAAKCVAYLAAGLVVILFRLPGNRDAAKELSKYVVITLIVWMLCEALKQPAPQQNWPDC